MPRLGLTNEGIFALKKMMAEGKSWDEIAAALSARDVIDEAYVKRNFYDKYVKAQKKTAPKEGV